MRPNAGDAAKLWDMLDACHRIARFISTKTEQQFTEDEILRSAVERQIEIIGEAARGVSSEFRAAHPKVPWRPIIAQRHILAHEYGDIQPPLIWRVATVHVPSLASVLKDLLPPRA